MAIRVSYFSLENGLFGANVHFGVDIVSNYEN